MSKFKNLNDACTAINSGSAKAAVAVGVWKKGDKFMGYPGCPAYVNGGYVTVYGPTGSVYNLTLSQVESAVSTKEEITKVIEEHEKQVEINSAKLKYMNATKQETFDETEFKVWNTLQLLKGKKNDVEKAKAIASLING